MPLLAVKDGLFVQAERPELAINGPGSRIRPGWIDAHSHIIPTGLDLLKLNLAQCQTPGDVLDAVRDWSKARPEGWLHAVQYDQTKFEGARHLHRSQLDAAAPDRPVLLRHSNGHASVANTAALVAAGISKDTPDPSGGVFVRDEDGELTGVLLERAHEIVTGSAPEPSLEEMVSAIMRAGELMAGFGITAAADMMTGRWDLEKELTAYRLASERGCPIRLRLSLQWAEVLGARGIDKAKLKELMDAMDTRLVKVIGLKIFADGAIGSATAAIHRTYKTTGGQGQLIYKPERLHSMVVEAAQAGWALAVHTIGDRSTDLVMDAFEATPDPSHHRIEHIMIMSDSQIERLARIGCHATMQPEFLYRFGHAYRAQLPDDVWPVLKRARSVLDAGIRLSFNTDRPIVPGIPEVGIDAAVTRPEGFDPSEAVTRAEAEAAWTTGGADAHYDAGLAGEVKEGQWADFRVVDEAGRTMETWMGGRQTWARSPE